MPSYVNLSHGLQALVDDADYDRLSSVSWRAKPIDRRGVPGWYAARTASKTTLYMHRYILAPPAHLLVDHVNGDGLDNRRINLRLATKAQNIINRRSTSASGFRGVEITRYGRFRARIYSAGYGEDLGFFTFAEDAAKAYDVAALERYGQWARLNFPTEKAA